MQPPRALWVPFELGRPLGVPGDAVWQKRVLRAALDLLEAPNGPVIVDFPDDNPVASAEPAILSCPVNFPAPVTDLNDMERLCETLQHEVKELRSWYDLAMKESGRTTVGVSGLDPEAVAAFVGAFLDGDIPSSPRDDMPALSLLKLANEDLKAYYFEAMAAQPGQKGVTGSALVNWFWRETAAGKVFFALRELWRDSDDSIMRRLSGSLLVPVSFHAESPYLNTRARELT